MCENLPNKWTNFIFLHKFCRGMHCFLEKFTQLEKFLHDGRSWRSRQISSLEDIINIKLIDCWGRRRARGPPVPHHFPEICSGFWMTWLLLVQKSSFASSSDQADDHHCRQSFPPLSMTSHRTSRYSRSRKKGKSHRKEQHQKSSVLDLSQEI